MTWADFILAAQAVFLLYFASISAGYIALNVLAHASLHRYTGTHSLDDLHGSLSGYGPPVSLLIPAYNEEATIATSVRSMLQLEYPELEVIVVNDGSKDGTLAVLAREFALVPFPEAYWRRLEVRQVRAIYRSTVWPNLRVIDKDNGGKADALNAGINAARYPLVCSIDADSILERASLRRVVAPFLDDPRTVAAGGTVRIANGCEVREGFLERVGLPKHPLALIQVIEYLRAFLFGRLGWTPLNAVMIISGAFGLFRKDAVVAAGGYRTDTVGEDMELVVRLHRRLRLARTPYRIVFVPDPVCWTEAPESLRVLRTQRVRWQRGLAESLTMNLGLLCHPRGGAPGWIAFPFLVAFEWLGPVIEVAGFAFFIAAFALGLVSLAAFLTFLLVAIGFGLVLSLSALLLEETSFHMYPRRRQLLALAGVAVIENLGYRQLVAVWRLWGLLRWAAGAKQRWGEMARTAGWQRPG